MSDTNTFTLQGRLYRIDSREGGGKVYYTAILDVDGGKYPQAVPVRLWGRTVDESKSWNPGDVLLAKGHLGGRSWNDKVFGDITADSVEVVSKSQRELPTGSAPDDGVPPPGDDGVPF